MVSIRSFIISMLPLCLKALSCYSDTGAPVGSWFISKLPSGTNYLYYDTSINTIQQSPNSLNDTNNGALPSTLKQLWVDTTDYMLFNDEPANTIDTATLTYGHTKGVWLWSNTEAVLLTHSIPLFPKGPQQVNQYSGLGTNAYTYAQSMACFTMTTQTVNTMASIATLTAPNIYERRVRPTTPKSLALFANGTIRTDALCANQPFSTNTINNLLYFAKSSQWNNELYSQCIGLALQTSLLVESWIRGSAVGPSCSGNYRVLDVQNLKWFNRTYKETQDHSKWAVSTTNSQMCIGDINRMTTQYTRGGGAICWSDAVLSSNLRNSILSTNVC